MAAAFGAVFAALFAAVRGALVAVFAAAFDALFGAAFAADFAADFAAGRDPACVAGLALDAGAVFTAPFDAPFPAAPEPLTAGRAPLDALVAPPLAAGRAAGLLGAAPLELPFAALFPAGLLAPLFEDAVAGRAALLLAAFAAGLGAALGAVFAPPFAAAFGAVFAVPLARPAPGALFPAGATRLPAARAPPAVPAVRVPLIFSCHYSRESSARARPFLLAQRTTRKRIVHPESFGRPKSTLRLRHDSPAHPASAPNRHSACITFRRCRPL